MIFNDPIHHPHPVRGAAVAPHLPLPRPHPVPTAADSVGQVQRHRQPGGVVDTSQRAGPAEGDREAEEMKIWKQMEAEIKRNHDQHHANVRRINRAYRIRMGLIVVVCVFPPVFCLLANWLAK